MTLDRRLNAYRDDLADAALKGRVEAARFAEPESALVVVPVADLIHGPAAASGLDTQLLRGDRVRVFERNGGWAWVQSERDGYVGYVDAGALTQPGTVSTHVVAVPRSFVYPKPDLKAPRMAALSMGSCIGVAEVVEARGTQYAELSDGGYMIAAHLRPLDQPVPDFVTVAETLLETPYLWGGASAFGIDCSGLVQLSMRLAGRKVLRDTDMQYATIGAALDVGPDGRGLQRGDLAFWKGHVAIMLDDRSIIHANGHTMTVAREPLAQAIDRIAYLYGGPTGFRRP